MVNVLQTIFKLLNNYLLREIFPSDDVDFSCVMIREVGEDPLSPALRDIEREGGARTALDTRWLRLLCLVCWCGGEALKVKKTSFTTKFKKQVLPVANF